VKYFVCIYKTSSSLSNLLSRPPLQKSEPTWRHCVLFAVVHDVRPCLRVLIQHQRLLITFNMVDRYSLALWQGSLCTAQRYREGMKVDLYRNKTKGKQNVTKSEFAIVW